MFGENQKHSPLSLIFSLVNQAESQTESWQWVYDSIGNDETIQFTSYTPTSALHRFKHIAYNNVISYQCYKRLLLIQHQSLVGILYLQHSTKMKEASVFNKKL